MDENYPPVIKNNHSSITLPYHSQYLICYRRPTDEQNEEIPMNRNEQQLPLLYEAYYFMNIMGVTDRHLNYYPYKGI